MRQADGEYNSEGREADDHCYATLEYTVSSVVVVVVLVNSVVERDGKWDLLEVG